MDRIEDFEVNSPRWLSLEDFEGEVWKDIPNYEGWYKGSNMGRIKSVDRWITFTRPQDSFARTVLLKSTILKVSVYGMYYMCHLKKHGTSKAVKIHRVICSLFHPNPDNLPEVNHINEIKTDNRAENLEWCTRLYNANWGTAITRASASRINHPNFSVKVYQYTLDGAFLAEYPSIKEAHRKTGVLAENIQAVCKNKRNASAGGFIWSYTQNPIDIFKKVNRKKYPKVGISTTHVCQYSIEGVFIREYDSIINAANATGANKTTISACCMHKGYQRTAGGYKWEFKEKQDRDILAKKQYKILKRRAIICHDLDGKFIGEYRSQRQAGERFGIDSSNVSRCCNGEIPSVKGYKFSFKE
jgi:hypothetical protein